MTSHRIKNFFDRKSRHRAEEFDDSPVLDYEQRRRRETLITLLRPSAGSRVLDLGCGNLLDFPFYLNSGCRYVGADLSPCMLQDGLKRHPRVAGALLVCDARRLPFARESFDLVVASELLEHVPGYEAVFDEMARIMKPGAGLVVTTPNRRSLYGVARWLSERRREWEHPFDVWKTRGELRAQVRRAGLVFEACRGACYLPAIYGVAIPRKLQKIIVRLCSPLEGFFSRALPACGYIVAVKARKPAAASI